MERGFFVGPRGTPEFIIVFYETNFIHFLGWGVYMSIRKSNKKEIEMKYIVERSSIIGEKPCEEAFLSTYDIWCKRNRGNTDLWQSEGKNHGLTEQGCETRQIIRERWTIELNSLDELNSFVEKYGNVIVGEHFLGEPSVEFMDSVLTTPKIIIYDDHIE